MLSKINQIQEKKNTSCSQLYIESKMSNTEKQNRKVVSKGEEVEEMRRCWSKCTKLWLFRRSKSRDP